MALPLKVTAPVTMLCALVSVLLAWLGVPNEQAWPLRYPNVLFVDTTSEESVVPLRYDNITLPVVSTSILPGVYQHVLFFYHDRADSFLPFENRQLIRVWECVLFCRPQLEYPSQLYLAHVDVEEEEKKSLHQWFLVELKERDKETPIVYARTKGRRQLQIDAPWVEPDRAREKPKPLPIRVYSIWDLLNPGLRRETVVWWKWLVWIASFGAAVAFLHKWCKDDDDF